MCLQPIKHKPVHKAIMVRRVPKALVVNSVHMQPINDLANEQEACNGCVESMVIWSF